MKSFAGIVAAAVLLQVADMASTEYMIRFSDSGEEINEFAASMQRSGSIWAFRLATICAIVAICYIAKIPNNDLEILKEASIGQIIWGKYRGSNFWLNAKVSMLVFVFSVSISRGIAAVSNIFGELIGFSIPILVSFMAPNANVHLISTVFSVSLSFVIMAILWNAQKHRI